MRALTVLQPWAWLIIHGGKDVENRRWPTEYRGLLAIHAGRSARALARSGWEPPEGVELEFGKIIGVVELFDVLPLSKMGKKSHWAEGPWCWRLRKPISIEPVACRGQLGLWIPPAIIIQGVVHASA